MKKRVHKELYDLLGLDSEQEDISQGDIKKAFQKRAKKAHPDKQGGSAEEMAKINDAYAVLRDPQKRARYDANGNAQEASASSTPTIRGADVLQVALMLVLIEPSSNILADLGFDQAGKNNPNVYTDFSHSSLLVAIKKVLDEMSKSVAEQKKEHADAVKALQRTLKQLRRKVSEGNDVLGALLKSRLSGHELAVQAGEEKLGDIQAARAMLKEYDFAFELPPESRYSSPSTDGFTIFKMSSYGD